MTYTSKKPRCPKCKSENLAIERRPDGNAKCLDCGWDGKYFYALDTSKKSREIWIRDEPNSVSWESLVGTQNYWGDRGICFVKKEDYQSLLEQCEKYQSLLEQCEKYQSLLEQCEKLVEALEKIESTDYSGMDEAPAMFLTRWRNETKELARQTLQEFKKFKGEV